MRQALLSLLLIIVLPTDYTFRYRFNLGASGFEGAAEQEVREGPVQFEKDNGDVFGVDKFLDEAKRGTKRGLDLGAGGSRKRQQLEKSGDRD